MLSTTVIYLYILFLLSATSGVARPVQNPLDECSEYAGCGPIFCPCNARPDHNEPATLSLLSMTRTRILESSGPLPTSYLMALSSDAEGNDNDILPESSAQKSFASDVNVILPHSSPQKLLAEPQALMACVAAGVDDENLSAPGFYWDAERGIEFIVGMVGLVILLVILLEAIGVWAEKRAFYSIL